MLQLLYIARGGLQVQQSALQTATHNLANAERPEYARQRQIRVAETARSSSGLVTGQIGMGVRAVRTERIRDPFFDRQIRGEMDAVGSWSRRAEALQIIEGILNELGDTGLQTVMGRFFDSLQELAKQPESSAVRALVAQRGQEFASAVNMTAQQLADQVRENEFQLEVKVQRVNELAVGIAELSNKILRVRASGQEPNDLLDQRDAMLDELSRLIGFQTVEGQTGVGGLNDLRVMVEGRVLNTPGGQYPLRLERGANGQLRILWAVDGMELHDPGGELAGILAAAYDIIPRYRAALDTFALGIRDAMNAIHGAGFDADGNPGGPFFTGSSSLDLQVDAAIIADPRRIAASGSGAIGDGSQALAMAQVAGSAVIAGRTPSDFLNEIMGGLAVETSEAIRRQALAEAAVQHYTDRRQEVMGVSQDEEMADIIRFQKAYAAMARVISLADQMLEELVSLVRR